MDADPRTPVGEDWLRPRTETQGLARYWATIKERWLLILAIVVLTTGAAAVYVFTAPKVFEGQADLLVTPVSTSDSATAGLGLITESNDPSRDVTTASKLITVPSVMAVAKAKLGLSDSIDDLLGRVTAEPVASSNLVAVVAQAPTAEESAKLANAVAAAAVQVRTDQLHLQIEQIIPRLQERLKLLPADQQNGPDSLGARIASLESLARTPDPTIRLATLATPPLSQTSPKVRLSLVGGIIAGLVLGIGAAFALQAVDPRLRREEQLRELFRLPILARVPAEPNTRKLGPLGPAQLGPGSMEAFRTLRAALEATSTPDGRARSILVTGSSPSEGKTTTAINFAYSLAQSGSKVILIEADLRRPTVGAALGVRPRYGIGAVLIQQVSLVDALEPVDVGAGDLRALLVERSGANLVDRLSLPAARNLVSEAETLADYVVVDSPPLTEVIDALPLAQGVDDVLVVARIGKSRLNRLVELGETLAQRGIRPVGFALVGVDRPTRNVYYQTDERPSGRDQALA